MHGTKPIRIALAGLGAGAVLMLGSFANGNASRGTPAPARAIELHRIGGFDEPVFATAPKGARKLLFVAELEGVIRVVRDGEVRGRPFLDISADVSTVGLSGLLGLAFEPGYRRNRLFYVYYTNSEGNPEVDSYRTRRSSPVRAAAGSRRKVIEIGELDGTGHIGGTLAFDGAGRLYLATGDGGGEGGDLDDDAQSKRSLAGKLLRIRPLARGPERYEVPRSNPYVGRPGADEIYSLGFRNPFRFSIDGRRILIGDVGEADFEEIDMSTIRGARSANFGWDHFEGEEVFDPGAPLTGGEHERPLFAYRTGSGRCSVTGGLVVRDRRLGALTGKYVYADYCEGLLRRLTPRTSGPLNEAGLGLSVDGPVGFGTDGRGRVWVAALNEGAVFRLDPS